MVHRSPTGHLLVDRPHDTRGDQLACGASHARSSVFEAEFEGAREVPLGHIEFILGDAVGNELLQFLEQQTLHFVCVVGLGTGIHLEHAGIGIRRHPRVHRIGQAAPLADLFEQSAGQAAAEHMVHHIERLAASVLPGQRATAHHDVHLLGVVVEVLASAHRAGRGALRPHSAGGHSGERSLDQRQHLVVRQRTRCGGNHAVRPIMKFEERSYVVGSDGLHMRAVATRVASERVTLEETRSERAMRHIVG